MIDHRYVRIVVRRPEGFLMVSQISLGGRYLFVGGKVEPNEEWVDAAIREFREEMNGEITGLTFLAEKVQCLEGGVMWHGRYYYADSIRGALKNLEPEKHPQVVYMSLLDIMTNPNIHKVTKDIRHLLKDVPITELSV